MNRKFRFIVTAAVLCGLLLTTGCAKTPPEVEQTQPETAPATEAAKPMPEPAPAAEPENPVPETLPELTDQEIADATLVSLRQGMVGTPQLFAAAYFGYQADADSPVDPFETMLREAPQLCEDLPFLLAIPEDHIVGPRSGELYCIVPADTGYTVAVNRGSWDDSTDNCVYEDVIYRSESGEPILLFCNNSGWEPDTQVTITDNNGISVTWYPQVNHTRRIEPAYNDNWDVLLFDFSHYSVPATMDLVGTWELAWTEVEGDRTEADPGTETIVITEGSSETSFRITRTNNVFPEENFSDKELAVYYEALYEGCDNDVWMAYVGYMGVYDTLYSLTILQSGELLLQSYWEFDGMPMVSNAWYCRVD